MLGLTVRGDDEVFRRCQEKKRVRRNGRKRWSQVGSGAVIISTRSRAGVQRRYMQSRTIHVPSVSLISSSSRIRKKKLTTRMLLRSSHGYSSRVGRASVTDFFRSSSTSESESESDPGSRVRTGRGWVNMTQIA